MAPEESVAVPPRYDAAVASTYERTPLLSPVPTGAPSNSIEGYAPAPPYNTTENAKATSVPNPASNAIGAVRYTAVSTCQDCAYLLRSDGIVDRTACGGEVSAQMVPLAPYRYVAVSAGQRASLLLRSDGVVVRTRGGGIVDPRKDFIFPPKDVQYVGVAAGPRSSFLLRGDGTIERIRNCRSKHSGEIIQPENWPSISYTSVSSGMYCSYFVRSDGKVDRRRWCCKDTISTPIGYAAVGEQWWSSYASTSWLPTLLLQADGTVQRISKDSVVDLEFKPPEGVVYTGTSTGAYVNFIFRSDGKVDSVVWQGHKRSITTTLQPQQEGVSYIGGSAGPVSSLLLRSDGKVDRFMTSEHDKKFEMKPASQEEFSSRRRMLMAKQMQCSWYGVASWLASCHPRVAGYINGTNIVVDVPSPEKNW